MPTYEYVCSSCNMTTEIRQKVADKELSVCPECGQETLSKKISSSVSLRFKGSGFYSTDYPPSSGCCGGCNHSGSG